MSNTGGVENVLKVWCKADYHDRYEGVRAYARYHDTMQRFADYYDIQLDRVVAVFVALSPNNAYLQNLRSMASVLYGVKHGMAPDEIITSTYNHCRDRAFNYAMGVTKFLEDAKGLKTLSFYDNILNPRNSVAVTVDGHMAGIWKGKRMNMKDAKVSVKDYHYIVDGMRLVADALTLVPCQLQATLWFTWKRIHNILYDPQTSLFIEGDQWKSETDPRHIKPYEKKEVVARPEPDMSLQRVMEF